MNCSKHAYRDLKTARTVANAVTHGRTKRRRGKVKALRAYQCPACGHYHLTKKNA